MCKLEIKAAITSSFMKNTMRLIGIAMLTMLEING